MKAGASRNASTPAKRFPLIEAASRGDTATCRLLVEAGADVDQRDEFGSTALHHSVRSQNIETVRELLDLGADVNAKEHNGVTPLWEAMSTYESVPLLCALLKAKPDLSICGPPFNYTPLEQAIEFELDEIADLLRAAGATESATTVHNGSLGDEEISVETDGEDKRSIQFSFWQAPVEAKDRALAEELSKGKVPAIIKNFGWQASPRHWVILEKCDSPIPLARVAYFARGWWNRPAGKELEDGPEMLGESYQAAVDRFVSQGLLRSLDATELVKLLVTTSDLKKVAKKHRIKVPSRRSEMIEVVLAKTNPEDFPDVLRRGPYFLITPNGKKAVQDRGDWKVGIEARLRSEIIEALLEPNLKRALLLSQEINSLNRRSRQIRPTIVCKARLVLENAIPPGSVNYQRTEGPVLRAIAAACIIVSGFYEWSQWRSVRVPTLDSGELGPLDFAFFVMSNDGSQTWDEKVGCFIMR